MADVLVVIDRKYAEPIDPTVGRLRELGMTVVRVDRDEGVVEGTLPTAKLAELRKIQGVDYVRDVFNYVAEQGRASALNSSA